MSNEKSKKDMGQVIAAINQADEAAAAKRVQQLRQAYPHATADALVGMLIKQKCLQTGTIGEVTSSASIIQGVGVFVSLIFGEAADAAMTARMQAELVLEIAAAYDRQLNPSEKQNALLLVSGLSDTINQVVLKTGEDIAAQANQQLAQHPTDKTTAQVTPAAGTNLLNTYLLGQRAKSYFQSSDPSNDRTSEPWSDTEFVIPQVESQTLAAWLGETTNCSQQMLNQRASEASGWVLVAGQALGEILLIDASGLIKEGWSQSSKALAGVGRSADTLGSKAGQSGSSIAAVVTDTAGKVGEMAEELLADTGRKAEQGLVIGSEVVADVGKKAGQGLTTGATKLGELAAGLLRGSKKDDDEK